MRRRLFTRLLSLLLAAAMALSLLPGAAAPAYAAGASPITGSISAALRLDYDQSLSVLEDRRVQAELLQGNHSLGSIDLTQIGYQPLGGGYTASVSHRDGGGETLGNDWPRFLDLSVSGLPQGSYTLRFSGDGYADYEETLRLEDYSLHLMAGTRGRTFSLGDFDADGRVDETDREMLSEVLGSTDASDLRDFDLNGDGQIDIIDLSYVNWQLGARDGAQILETTLLAPPVDTDALEAQLASQGVAVDGNLEDLFRPDGGSVTFQAAEGQNIVLPFGFSRTQELEQVRIVTPDAYLLGGTVTVEDEDGRIYEYAFDRGETQILSAQDAGDDNAITIDLGGRVPVKKVTVTVTKTDDGYATLESIEFLKEMIPADPDSAGSQVTGLSAVPGDGQVSLTWNRLPNITGYRVSWWPTSNPAQVQTMDVEVNRAEVTGLENLIEYQFTVTATAGDWTGRPSAPISATPIPAKAPSAPDMVSVSSRENALAVSWKASKGATYYEVYYTDQENAPTSSYRPFGGEITGTSTTITGLENGVAYYIYIIAGNDIGRSGPSRIASGTPEAVVYERPAGIPTQGVLDYQDIASIRLADPNNYSRTEYPNGFDPRNMADGDYRTHWTVRNWSSNEHVIVTFKEPQDLRAAIWIPRLDGTYATNLRAYSVQVWYDGEDLAKPGHLVTPGEDNNGNSYGGDVHTWPAIRGNPAVTKFAIMPFLPQKDVVQVSVAAEQRDYLDVSLSEIMFLKYDENFRLPEDIEELFADELRTALVPGVTAERVAALRARLNSDEVNYYMESTALSDELDLAEVLLGLRAGSSVFVNGVESRRSGRDGSGQGGSALQPIGAAAGVPSNAKQGEITIYASGIPAGEKVAVYATEYNAEASAWLREIGTLENGRNVLYVPKISSQNRTHGGSLYLAYDGDSPGSIRLHVRRAVDIPMLELSNWNSLTQADRRTAINAYLAELDRYLQTYAVGTSTTDWRNVTEIATPSVLLSLPAGAVQAGLSGTDRAAQLENSILAWEEIMSICYTVQGITIQPEARQNIRCMQMFAGAFMYAAGNHVGIGFNSCAGMTGGAPLSQLAPGASANQLFGWGIAHEIGHNMDKLGKAEITNNIYSLAVQTSDGGQNTLPSRLEKSSKYEAIFNKTAQGRPGASGDVFVQLGMYWQLHLAYDDGAKPLDFYSRFFTAWKAQTYFSAGDPYDDRVALTASAVAGRDLTEFFTRWGMTLSDSTKDKLKTYPAEARAIWYLNDQSRRDRLAGGSSSVGTVTAQSEKVGDNQFRLDFSAPGKVQGYEIQRNGKAIAFVSGDTRTYTDTIGSGNNLTYAYTVVAYDTLGYKIGQASTAEYKVSYDLLVDSSAYKVTRTGNTVQIDLSKPTAVSGLRLPLAGLGSGNFQITVTEEDGTETQVRTGDFANSNQAPEKDRFISYFQRKGAANGDALIGTYQAKRITVTGIPETVADKDVQLISYAGDDISFLDGPTVGRMEHDYRYGNGADDVIKAGTLVILGNYQGDPVYNTVRIYGEFAPADMKDGSDAAGESVQRYINGYSLIFADEQPDSIYGTICNGFFLFVPDVQAEKDLLEGQVTCGIDGVLPSRIRAELWRTDTPDSAEGTRLTAQTMWISSPGGTDLPVVKLEGGNG